ncbi:MAG: acetyl-CoA carboxylase biotin carboxylase subunit [Nitriliruptoraceae bacterium]|nr:acetyl-CoA carboxylase biotin carboxylase subunit [Nitriliruptoraceae bacterium]
MPLQRVLVANRGEIAVRVLRACRTMGIETVLGVSEADQDTRGVALADRVVRLGPAAADRSYLDEDLLIEAAVATGCDAVHPGYGFLAERSSFARAVEEAGLRFVGPTADSIELMGDKLRARAVAEAAAVPVVPGSEAVASVAEAREAAWAVGYPLMLKASAGGGGRGIQVVRSDEELGEVFEVVTAEVAAAFGDPRVFLERFVASARHVEVQVLGDGAGKVITLGERDCSLQRRFQKIVEEAPAHLPSLDEEHLGRLRSGLFDAARSLASSIDYRGAGTVEFIVDQQRGDFFFLEMNTRIQVEHPVTEEVTGIDLVAWQLRIAGGEPLDLRQEEVRLAGHAIEVRLTAEQAAAGFMPTPGLIERWMQPGGPGVRVDTHCYPGYRVPVNYDSLLCKLIVHGPDRPTALRRLAAALDEFHVEGVATTRDFLLELIQHPEVVGGRIHTRWVESAELATLR